MLSLTCFVGIPIDVLNNNNNNNNNNSNSNSNSNNYNYNIILAFINAHIC